ncbi:MAG: (d)CMP kinase [Candidatus Dormibacteraeota bacterium]|nr:(d)CMP kinase [Candidatus Dormibacteraeota bacterium]
MIIAIDGPAGSGKSAVGRRVAEALGLPFVDSGLMYRAVAIVAAQRGIPLEAEAELERLAASLDLRVSGPDLTADGEDLTGRIYAPDVSAGSSRVAAVAGVRRELVGKQRALGGTGVVMAGRDIGTVVFPGAGDKFYLTASAAERARRRTRQIEARGGTAAAADLQREIEERDRRDAGRAVSPMHPAPDAEVIETDGLDLEAVVAEVLRRVGDRQ